MHHNHQKPSHRILIIGGGFGGLNAAATLRDAPADITLLDKCNFHLFQPLLYQVASGALSPANIAMPLREILRKQTNTTILLGEALHIDAQRRHVILEDDRLEYDTLVVAAGSSHSYFGNDQWQELAPGLKTVEDATEIRQRVLMAFEAAERARDPQVIRRLLTFVIVGAGPTGVELAGALGEITQKTLRGNFRRIDPADACIYLVEGTSRVLPPYTPDLSAKAAQSLLELGVQVRTDCMVTEVHNDHVVLKAGAHVEKIETATIIWAAGVKASPLGQSLCETTGANPDRSGRVMVNADLSVPNFPDIFVVGDLAHLKTPEGPPLPAVAPVAMQQGQYVGRLLKARLQGQNYPPFRYRDYGSMATIGRGRAVAHIRGVRFSGFFAWLTWLLIHLLKLVGFHNKVLVTLQWGWNYLTYSRSARLITGRVRAPRRLRIFPSHHAPAAPSNASGLESA